MMTSRQPPWISETPLESSTALPSSAVAQRRPITGRQLLPSYRLTVIAKTPMMIALGLYMAGSHLSSPGTVATMVLASLLWGALYAVNESTDLLLEKNFWMEPRAQQALLALPLLICLLAAWVSPLLGVLFLLMTVGQLAYCVPPVRLKRHWWAILILSGTINPMLRLLCGAIWGVVPISPLTYGVFVCLHLGATIRSRVLLRDRDRGFGYRVAPPRLEVAGILCSALGLAGAYWLCWQGTLPRVFALFILIATVFACYAWSGRATNLTQLRQGWLWFAILSLFALFALLGNH
jgi:hypothetical protein